MKELLLICLCILLFGIGTFFKRLGLIELHPYQFLLITAIVYFAAAPLWLWLLSHTAILNKFTTTGIWYSVIYAVFSLAAGIILAFLLKETTQPGTIIVMVNMSAVITLILSSVFLHETLTPIKIAGVVLAVVSLALINS